jgi:Family of unknown function (DUF5715)
MTACSGPRERKGVDHFVYGARQNPILALLLTLAFCSQAFGLHQYVPSQRNSRTHRHGHVRRLRWNPVFRPSHDSLLRQNAEIDRMELPRIQNETELEELVANGQLVPIVASDSLRIEPRLDPKRRYCRPWTRDFLQDVSDAYYQQFHSQLQVNSAVRTVQVQKKLRRHNRNAAPETGETASSHLAGITVDIQRRGMTRKQIQWMEQYMAPLRDLGLIEPEEERRQWVFHVAVSGRYADWREAKMLLDKPQAVPQEQSQARVQDPTQSQEQAQEPLLTEGKDLDLVPGLFTDIENR